MRKIKFILGTISALFIMSCEGPQGPPGFDGIDALQAEVFEQTLTFTFDAESNTWNSETITFDGALSGDVYLGFVSLGNGVFTSLPASFFDEFGEYQYVFEHDFNNVQFQIIGDNDLSTLDASITNNILTRVAVIPADLFSSSNLVEGMDISSLMTNLNISENDIILQ
jgi:hypothetical protein